LQQRSILVTFHPDPVPHLNDPMRNRLTPPLFRSARSALFAAVVLAWIGGCGAPPPALQVGDAVMFPEAELGPLTPTQLELAASLAALALARAEGRIEALGAPRLADAHRGHQVQRLREEVILEGAGVDDAALEARYAAGPDHELVVRHLVLLSEGWASGADRARARDAAEAALSRILGGEPFEEVAADVSEEPGAATRGGLLRPGRRGSWVEPFWAAASALPEGGVSGVVETPFGFHVLKLEERRVLPFADARARVVREVAGTLGGGAAWEAERERLEAEIVIVPPAEAPRPAFASPLDLARLVPAEGPPLATWPGGSLTPAAFRRALLARTSAEIRRAASDPAALEELLADAARQHRLADAARGRGIEPAEEDSSTALRSWEETAAGWAVLLGMSAELRPSGIPEAVIRALGTTGQNATIARDAAGAAAPMLLAAYPLRGTRLPDPPEPVASSR
jgi:peptidyl-prolyl cis-trans isomerase NIMA-interacting 1